MGNELRIFVSSPGDVGRERELSAHVLKRLQGEYARRVKLTPYFWEHEPMRGNTDYQGNIPKPSDFDIVICILWSRLGSRLNAEYRHADGSPYSSGTEYEFEVAMESRKTRGTPEIFVYRNRQQPMIPIEPRELVEEKMRQREALQEFIQRWFVNPDGTFRIAANDYRDLAEFEDKFESHMRKIIEEKAPPLSAAPSAIRFGTYLKGSPFRRLRAFEFEDAEVFFGRTKAIDDVLNAMQAQATAGTAFTLVFGGSGSGKSSLARAGVMPLLVTPGVIDGIGLWRWAVARPGEAPSDIFGGLAAALLGPTALPELAANGTSADELAKALREAPAGVPLLIKTSLTQAARDVQAKEQLTATPVARFLLLVDQLEEIFTMGDRFPLETRTRFVAALAALARSGVVWVLATLRSEFFSRCDEMPELVTLKSGQGQYQLMPPTKTELSQIVRLPAIAAGLEFETDNTGASLDDVLLDAAGRNAGALPLIEFTLDELYKRRRDDRVLTHSAFAALHGIEGALETAAEEVFTALSTEFPAEIEPLFATVFRALVTIDLGEKEAFVRRITDLDRLANAPARQRFIQAFVEGRLLVTDKDEEGRAVVQVAHESLFLHWPRLNKMLEANREFLQRRARASASYGIWKEQRADRSFLWWSGRQLEEARELLARGDELTPREKEFAEASVRAGASARRRKLLAAAAGVVLAVGAGVAGYFWWTERQAAAEVRDWRDQLTRVVSAPQPIPATVLELSGRILQKEPSDSATQAIRASALLEMKDYDAFHAALQEWEQAVSPKAPKIDDLRGDEAAQQGRPPEAIQHWAAYLGHPKLSLEERRATWRKLAAAHAGLGQWVEARDRLTEWIDVEDNLKARIQRAKAHQQLRDWDAARRDFERAREINPSDAEVKNFGPITSGQSIEALNERVQKSPRDAAAWLARAVELTRQRQFPAALEDIDHALDLDPDSTRLLIEKAHLHWQLQQPIPVELGVAAGEKWTRESGAFPASFAAMEAQLDALSAVDARVKNDPPSAALYLERAGLLSRLSQHALAVRDCTSALEADERSVAALQLRAASQRALGQTAAAEADLLRAKQIQTQPAPPP